MAGGEAVFEKGCGDDIAYAERRFTALNMDIKQGMLAKTFAQFAEQ